MIDTSKFVETLNGKPAAVFGLGKSGISTIAALTAGGADVVAWDDRAEMHDAAAKAGADLVPLEEQDFTRFSCLVLAPGVPIDHAVAQRAREAGVEIIGDIEILHRSGHGRKTIGVTGTNGKSTTVALIHHILESCGVNAVLGGNIGAPVLTLDVPSADGFFVLELSSFQIDLCPAFRPDISALLNITPDHIDRHGTLEEYAAIKERIMEGPGVAIIGVDHDLSRAVFERTQERGERDVVSVSVDDVSHIEGLSDIATLQGTHNHQNALIAHAVARACGLADADIFAAMRSFPGLPHRQFLVRVINGVAYINDSKATNADATAKALACHKNIYWIVGGRAKDGGLNGLDPYLDKIKSAYLIGEAVDDFADWFQKRNVSFEVANTMDVAVRQAHDQAQKDRGQPGGAGTVLLSPACASYDQFKSFEERGDVFTALVSDLREGDE